MGPCIAGGAYLPALSDVIVMVDGTSFMGLGGPNLVKGAIGHSVDAEPLGGGRMHTSVSGVAHYLASDDAGCLQRIRTLAEQWEPRSPASEPGPLSEEIYSIVPADHRLPYDMRSVVALLFEDDLEFQADNAPEMLCAHARLDGRRVALIANRRGFLKTGSGPRIGGIVYTETARKVAYFVEGAERQGLPIVYLQDVSGFMVGPNAEREGIIRAGAEMVESMACATVPKLVLTLNHASGAGYYAMAGQGFDPHFTFSWPTARIGVMEGDSAVQALYSADLERHKAAGAPLPDALQQAIERTRADYERWLDARYAAARGHVDAVIDPRDTRAVLALALDVASCRARGEHLVLERMA
jgi:acetyl-CoA carboxylase carboxyltransferase component